MSGGGQDSGDRAQGRTSPSGAPLSGSGSRGKGFHVSRVSKRPSRAPAGSVAAARLLSEVEVAEGLRLDQETLDFLRLCSTHPPRRAATAVSAIKLRLEFSQPKPRQDVGLEVSGRIEVVDPYARGQG